MRDTKHYAPAGETSAAASQRYSLGKDGLRKIKPYNYRYTTWAKERWLGRELLEMFSTEFRDRSKEYYEWAIESGTVTVNDKKATCDTVLKNGEYSYLECYASA